ncbi:hypothetical protein COO60DRAFT_370215 [Scenedesmus sp. NREL 46B-D3]|nr:hypothetical protein COO60DRAFT_370215 [Scenedesmus sp. NREL 46B-D3]
MQQTHIILEKVAAAAEQPRTALPPRAPVASMAAGRIFSPAATAVAAPAAAAAEATCTGLTALEHKTALYMLNLLGKYKEADPFKAPVDWLDLGIPDYPDVIKHPMDLKTAREKVHTGAYKSMDEWRADMKLIWENCRTYNGTTHVITRRAEKLEAAMERRMEEAVTGAARELSAAQLAGAGGLAGKGTTGGSTPKPPGEVALLLASVASNTSAGSDSNGEDGGRQAGPALRMAVRQQHQPSPEPVRRPFKRVAACSDEQATGTATAAQPPAAGPAAAADGTGGLAKRGRLAGNDLNGSGNVGVPATAGVVVPDADDLAFLVVWKRVVAQRTTAASEAQRVRHAANKLKRSLLTSEQEARQLRYKLDEEAAVRADIKRQLTEMQAINTKLQEEHKEQRQVLEHQRQLLQQQQQVLRQFLEQQHPAQQQAPSQPASPSAPLPVKQEYRWQPAAAAALLPSQAVASQPAPPAAVQGQQQRPHPLLLSG